MQHHVRRLRRFDVWECAPTGCAEAAHEARDASIVDDADTLHRLRLDTRPDREHARIAAIGARRRAQRIGIVIQRVDSLDDVRHGSPDLTREMKAKHAKRHQHVFVETLAAIWSKYAIVWALT